VTYRNRDVAREGARGGGAAIIIGIIAFIVVIVLATMWIFGLGFFSRATADFRGETSQIERVQADPDYRIASYDRFFNLCGDIKTKEQNIINLELELETTEPDSPRADQLRSGITAQRNIRAGLINDYNADATKEDTRANFQASSLPFQLNPTDEETTCAL